VVFLWCHKLQLFSMMRYLHIVQVCSTAVTEAKPCGQVCATQNTSDPKGNFYETNACSCYLTNVFMTLICSLDVKHKG